MAASRERRKYDPVATREAILVAAIELFGQKGFHATAVSELVKAAGLTKGAFYHHFDSKEEVLAVIHDRFIDRFIERQARAVGMPAPAHDQLLELVMVTAEIIAEYLAEAQIFFADYDPAGHGESLAKRQQAFSGFRDLIVEGMDTGEFLADLDPDLAALEVLGACNWMFMWYRPNGRRKPHDIGTQFGLLMLRGLSARPEMVGRALANRSDDR